jgi:hypothetical protein
MRKKRSLKKKKGKEKRMRRGSRCEVYFDKRYINLNLRKALRLTQVLSSSS